MSASLGQWWVRLARRGLGGGSLRLWPFLVGREVLPVFLGFRGSGPGFSAAHFWSLLHWRRLSVVLPAAMVDCCLASLRAGVCSPPWRWRFSARVLMVACLPLLRGRWSAPSPIPWPILDLTLVLSRCKNLAWLVSWRWWLVLG